MEFQLICDRLWTYLLKELNNYEVKIPITLIKGFNSFVSLISDNPNIFADKVIKTVGKLLFKILLWHRESSKDLIFCIFSLAVLLITILSSIFRTESGKSYLLHILLRNHL